MAIVIGDLHGCFKTFKALLKKLPDDEIFLTGDIIDRGPRSKQNIDFLIKHPEIKSVMGNHELFLIKAQDNNKDRIWWLNQGGYAALYSYTDNGEDCFNKKPFEIIGEEHTSYIKNLPLYIEKNGLFISHSIIQHSLEEAIDPNWLDSPSSIVWARNGITKRINNCFHIFGHTIQKEPLIRDYWANIDTGAFLKEEKEYGKLTALQYPSMEIFQQENID
jgi:serine/threonine protein phosphatase 1